MARPVPKEEVRRLLDTMPDEASYDEIHYHLYVQQKIDRGLEAAERSDFISDEEIKQRISRWSYAQGGRLRPGRISRNRRNPRT